MVENREIKTSGDDIKAFLKIIKGQYAAFKDVDDTGYDCAQPFSQSYPEFFHISDNQDYGYEFLMRETDAYFLRGFNWSFCANIGILRNWVNFLEEKGPYPGKEVKRAVNEEYFGYILKWGVTPATMNVPTIMGVEGVSGYIISDTEKSYPENLTTLCQGRYPKDAGF